MNLSLHKATKKDIPEILEIADSHYYTFGPQGFLVSKYDYKVISGKINNPNSDIYVTKNEKGEVLSWLIISRVYHTLTLNGINVDDFTFKDDSDKELVSRFNHWHMEQGAVRKDMLRSGIGSFYYTELFKLFSDHSFSSNVIRKPVNNRASVKIKKVFGFREAGLFDTEEHKSIKDFQMTMFIREPEDNIDPQHKLK